MAEPLLPNNQANVARKAKNLLDLMSRVKTVATALDEIVNTHGSCLQKKVVKDLELLSEVLIILHNEGRKQVEAISVVKGVLRGYNIATKFEREKEIAQANHRKISDSILELSGFMKQYRSGQPISTSTTKSMIIIEWSDEAMAQLKTRSGSLQKNQLDAVAYLWEMFYDLALSNNRDNVSSSPGFEAFGLRINNETANKKRKRED